MPDVAPKNAVVAEEREARYANVNPDPKEAVRADVAPRNAVVAEEREARYANANPAPKKRADVAARNQADVDAQEMQSWHVRNQEAKVCKRQTRAQKKP